jgi:hypothetical protein
MNEDSLKLIDELACEPIKSNFSPQRRKGAKENIEFKVRVQALACRCAKMQPKG